MKTTYFIQTIIFVLLCGVISCEKTPACKYGDEGVGSMDMYPPEIKNCVSTDLGKTLSSVTDGKKFNTAKFVQVLKDSLTSFGGVQYAVYKNGTIYLNGASGVARGENACPSGSLTPCQQMNIASCTKLITAACVVKMLYEQGLDEEDTIGPFLPTSWNVPATMKALRFEDLMRHRSGLHPFTANNNFDQTLTYAALKTLAETGPDSDSIGFSVYRNANLALMRIIIPALWKKMPSCPNELKNAGDITDAISQKYYEMAIRAFVLDAVGAEGELDDAVYGDFATLYFQPANGNSDKVGNWKDKAGGGGWFMTALDMAKLIDGMYNGSILTTQMRDAMLNKSFGFWNNTTANDGQLRGHSGDIRGLNTEMHSVVFYHTTQNIAIAVNINSGTKGGAGLIGPVRSAYNQAWE